MTTASISRDTRLGILLSVSTVISLALLVYAPSISHGFINTDDDVLIEENRTAHSLTIKSVTDAWTTFDPELYVPVTTMSYQVQSAIFGEISPSVTHAIAILLHACTAGIVVVLAWLLTKRIDVGFVAGMIFALHPINAEAVLWASSRKDLLSALFAACAMYYWVRHAYRRNARVLIFFTLSVLCKPSSLLLPVGLIGFAVVQGNSHGNQCESMKPMKANVLRMLIQYADLLIVLLITACIGYYGKSVALQSTSLWQMILLAPQSIGLSLAHLFVPWKLSLFYPYQGIDIGLLVLGIGALIGCVQLLRYGDNAMRFGTMMALALFAPSLASPIRNNELYLTADHYMYGAMIGVSILLSYTVCRLPTMIRMVVIAVMTCFFLWQTSSYVQLWSSTSEVYKAVLTNHPRHVATLNNLGVWELEHGDSEQAILHLQRALAEVPEFQKARINLAAAHVMHDDIASAERILNDVPLNERDASFGFVQAQIDQKKGNIEEAIFWYANALNQDPMLTKAWNNLGVLFLSLQKWKEAAIHLEQAALQPDAQGDVFYNLGIAYEQQELLRDAESAYRRAVQKNPTDPMYLGNLAVVQLRLGDRNSATATTLRLQKVAPNDPKTVQILKALTSHSR